jgi:hypothetical protein
MKTNKGESCSFNRPWRFILFCWPKSFLFQCALLLIDLLFDITDVVTMLLAACPSYTANHVFSRSAV